MTAPRTSLSTLINAARPNPLVAELADETATPEIPAERIVDGVARQIVNVFNRDGSFNRQLAHVGTEDQARAKAALQSMHDTHPEYAATVAQLRGA